MIEGWAVYAERMMIENGWGGGSPEMALMYAKWNLRVVCRHPSTMALRPGHDGRAGLAAAAQGSLPERQ